MIEPDQGDVNEAVRLLASGEKITVGSLKFVEQIRAAAPFYVNVRRIRNNSWSLKARCVGWPDCKC